MMTYQENLSLYEEIAGITTQMLDAARTGDWDLLIALENQCSHYIQMLKEMPPSELLSVAVREKKIGILKKILADDKEIRTLTEPRLAHLASLISSAGNERKLSRTYHPNSG